MSPRKLALTGALVALAWVLPATAQQSQPASCLPQGMFGQMQYQSVEQHPDGRVTFRLCAPAAQEVSVTSSDIANAIPPGAGQPMTKDESGLWSATTPVPIAPDNYRYNFQVDGARVPDPLATTFSRERTGINSTVNIEGPEGAFQTYNPEVPHGMVSHIEYWSDAIDAKREAYVYTPPGYMNGSESYPVLYLVHGIGDSSDSWTQVGHANYILDNLLAEGSAEEMIVVMPFSHTPDRPGLDVLDNRDFGNDLHEDLIPYIDSHFRTIADTSHRAMAGLSMGGAHTIRWGLTRPDVFSEIGIFSMGLGLGPDDIANYTNENHAALARSAEEMDLVYLAMGTEDFLYGTVAPTRAMFDEAGIEHIYNESGGGHTWINWRRYLHDFLPRLFQD